MTTDLKPCPFCGKEPIRIPWKRDGHTVACRNVDCLVKPETIPCWSEEEADEAWNRRKEDLH